MTNTLGLAYLSAGYLCAAPLMAALTGLILRQLLPDGLRHPPYQHLRLKLLNVYRAVVVDPRVLAR